MAESIYFYNPSLAAAILFAILYLVPLIAHCYMLVVPRYRGKYQRIGYYILILIGTCLETAAYCVRAASTQQPWIIGLFATSSSLVVIAPVFICASLYILIGRLMRLSPVGEETNSKRGGGASGCGNISPLWIPRAFIASDVISLLAQASGSGIASSNDWKGSMKDIGLGVLLAGLVLQLVTFSCFLMLVTWFDMRISTRERRVRSVVEGIYIAGFFMMIRLIYRVIEFAMDMDTYTWTHEWPLYVLESTPILFALLVLAWYHPGRLLTGSSTARSGCDGT